MITIDSSSKWQTVVGVLKRILRTSLFTYLLVVIVLTFLQRQLLYHPRTATSLNVADFEDVMRIFENAQDVQLTCDDGILIKGWLLRKHGDAAPNTPRRPLALFFHGNAGNRAGRIAWYRLLEDVGADVLAIDYHGYGDSGGKMSEDSLQLDCDATWKFAINELGYDPADIYVVGSSLGGAAAVYASHKACADGATPGGLAVAASFSSMVDVGRSLYPWLPVRAVLVDRYPSAKRIAEVTCRVLVMHGDQDTLVQPRFGRELFDAAPSTSACGTPKQWLSMNGAGHNDILSSASTSIRAEMRKLIDIQTDTQR